MFKFLVFAVVLGLGLGLGGYEDQDATDPKWMGNIESLMQTGLLRTMDDGQFQIEQVKTQVVAGINTFYAIRMGQDHCNLTVYTDLSSQNHVTEDTCHLRATLIGGFTPVTDMTAEQFQKAVGMTLNMASNQINTMYQLEQTRIITASQQVVAGLKYHIKLEAALSGCMKESTENAACSITPNPNKQRYIIDSLILWQAWMTPQFSVLSLQITIP